MSAPSSPASFRRPASSVARGAVPLFLCAAAALLLSSCGESGPKPPAGKGGGGGAVPVVAGEVIQKDMPVILPGIGNVRAFSQVTIKPRVSGQVDKVMFTEGQEVNEGDIVIQMDPKPFEVALTQAKARLEQAESAEELAQIRADRGLGLQKSGAVAREEIDQLKNALRVAKANVEVEKAAVRGAELQLSYCTIRSPLRGRTGRRAVDAGNVVKADETDLMSIYQLRPIEVVFSLAEQHLGDITRQMKSGDLAVTIKPNESGANEAVGKLTFVDNTVKAATGTIDVKAQFPNEDLTLWPGQYGEVALTLSVQRGAIVVPSAAVQTGQSGSFVYVVKSDNTAEVRPVKVQRVLREESVISEGLKPGEIVVVDGQLRLTPGIKVELKPPVGSEHSRGSQPIAQDGKGGSAPVP
jgi:multidrug efflux system membrane fusion protein